MAYGLSLANIIEFTQWLSVGGRREGRMFLVTALVAIPVHSHSKSPGNLLRNAGDEYVLRHMRSVRHAGATSRNLLLHSPCSPRRSLWRSLGLRASVVNSSPLGTTIYHMLCSLESISHPRIILINHMALKSVFAKSFAITSLVTSNHPLRLRARHLAVWFLPNGAQHARPLLQVT